MRRLSAAGHVMAALMGCLALWEWQQAAPSSGAAAQFAARLSIASVVGVLSLVVLNRLHARLPALASASIALVVNFGLLLWAFYAAIGGINGAEFASPELAATLEPAVLSATAWVALVLAFVLVRPCGRRARRQGGAILGLCAALPALASLVAHAVSTGPMAWPGSLASAALAMMALVLVSGAGTDVWPVSLFAAPARRHRDAQSGSTIRGLLLFMVLIMGGIGAAGFLYISREQQQARQTAQELLAAVADLKAQGISSWYRDRRADAELLAGSTMVADELERILDGSASERDRAELLAWMEELSNRYSYVAVALFDSSGTVRLLAPNSARFDSRLSAKARAMSAMLGVQSEDLHREGERQDIRMDFWVPVHAGVQGKSGVLLLQIDPHIYLYPALQTWPMPSATAETLLVRRDGDAVLFLNELRHRAHTALQLRISLQGQRALPALLAVAGTHGVVEGLDYRDVPVLAAVREVPGTPWYMVAKVDRSEIYAPLRERAWTLSLLVGALALVGLLGIVVLWRQRNLRVLERELALQQANSLGELRYRRLVENISDALMIDDVEGRVVYANDRFLAMFGYSREELLELKFDDFCDPEALPQVRANHERRIAGEQVQGEFENLAVRKDGSRLWAHVRVSTVVEQGRMLGTQSTIQDITERKRAIDALRDSEKRYRLLAENVSDVIWTMDLHGRRTYISPAIQKLRGLTVEQAMAEPVEQAFAGTLPEDARQRIMAARTGKPFQGLRFEAPTRHKNGSTVWVEVNTSSMQDDRGNVVGILGVSRDISERRQAEQTQAALLQISEAAHAAPDMADLYRRIHQIIGALMPAENIYVALYDEAKDEVSFPYFVDAFDPPPPPQRLGDISLTATVLRSGEALLLTPDANTGCIKPTEPIVGTAPIQWVGAPLICKSRTIGVLAVQSYDASAHYTERDKTLLQFVGAQVAAAIERKQAEAALRESEAKFHALFDQSPNLIGLLTIPEGRFVEVNHAALAAFGGSYEEIIGRTSTEIGIWVDLRERERYLAMLQAQGSVHDFETTLRRKSGETFPVLYSGSVVTIGGARFSFNVIQDISARKQAERRLGESKMAIRNLELALDEHAIVAITDPDGSISYVNDKFCTVTGYSRVEVIGKNHKLFNSDYHPSEFFDAMWETIRSGRVWKGEIRNRSKSGAHYWVDSTIVPFLNAAGTPYQYVTIRTDITERKRAEEWQRHYAHTLGLITAEAPLYTVLERIATFAERHSDNACCVILLNEAQGARPVRGAAANKEVTLALAAIAARGIMADAATRRLIQLGHGDGLADGLWQHVGASGSVDGDRDAFPNCSTEPIIAADREVLGTLAVYQLANASPRPEHMALLRQSAALAALAIERARHQSDQRLAKVVFEQSVEAIVVSDHADRILMVNPAFEELTGYAAANVLYKTPYLLHSDRHDALFYERINDALTREDWWQGEFWCQRKSGDSLPMLLSVVAVRDAVGAITHRIRVMADISEQKFQAARIEQLAFYDSLTDLPNRALFLDRLEQTLEAARRHGQHGALLFLDLDRFKEINDSQGHAVGDEALVQVARRFVEVSRKEETLARLGGDEFVLIAEGARQAAAALIAERMLRVLTEPLQLADTSVALAASIGIALYPDDGDTVEDLIKHADIAMYRAKASGAGFRFYQPAMGDSLRKRLGLTRRLELALEHGGLRLHYQPKVQLTDHRLSGAEALLRWHDAELGWVSPAEFIPLAEERGLIGALGQWVLREACIQLAAWRSSKCPMVGRLAINLSALQLHLPNIVDTLVSQVHSAGLNTELFELELTESSMMADPEGAIATMDALHRAGFSLAVDDFGTGYSSLVYLKRFAADNIKIDMSFVRDMLSDRNDAAIVSTIIAMARNLGLKTTAEGVEGAGQAEALLKLGCDFAQGFYFGCPEPPDVFAAKWLGAGVPQSSGVES